MNFLAKTGDIWYIPMHIAGIGIVKRHIFILDFYQGIEYRNCDTIVETLVMETGERYKTYLDVLESDGVKIEDASYRRDMGL